MTITINIGYQGSSVAILNMKKKNVLRMINFDAEVATVVRTTIARSDIYVHLYKIYQLSLYSCFIYSGDRILI